jgi:hypothetical protein
MSVVSTGSKLVASGAVGPDVSAHEIVGATVFTKVSRIKNAAIAFRNLGFRIIKEKIGGYIN